MRLMIAPALRIGLPTITSPHEPYVVMPEATAKQFFLSRLRAITDSFNILHFVSEKDRRSAFSAVVSKMADTVPQPADLTIIAVVDSLKLGLSATDVTLIIEQFEEITVLPAAVIERMRIYKPDAEMAALLHEGSRMRDLRVLDSVVQIWKIECLSRGLCANRGKIWELTPEGAQRAYMAALPRLAELLSQISPTGETLASADPSPLSSSTDGSAKEYPEAPLKRTKLD
jgi:hypothetical protein